MSSVVHVQNDYFSSVKGSLDVGVGYLSDIRKSEGVN